VDSIYFNGIVLLTIWIVYSSNWNSFRLCLNISASILKHSAYHIWISLTRISSLLRASQNIYRMTILFIYIVFSMRDSSLIGWSPQDSLGRAEYNIPLYMANKSIAIILIPNKYYEFRAQCKFVCVNFIGEVHIYSTTKDTEVWYFRFFTCEDLLRCFLFEMFNRSTVIDIGSSCKSKLLPGR